MRYGNEGIGWGGWIVMVAMMVVFWGAVAWVIVTLIRQNGSRPPTPDAGGPDPGRTLDERFARGEIDDDEYKRRRDVLRGGA
jgi:putative membrane protein